MSGVESLLHGSWLLNCDAMTDVVLLQTVYKVLRRKHILVVLNSQRGGTPGGDGQYWPSCGTWSPSSKPHSALPVSS